MKITKTVTALLATATLALTITACSPSLSVSDKPDAPQTEATPWNPPPKEETPEPAPAPQQGTLANPFPAGHTFTVEDKSAGVDLYSATVSVLDYDAQKTLIDANQFNDLAPAGQRYVLVQVTITGLNADKPVDPGMEAYDWNVADSNGGLYKSEFVVTPGESISGAPELYAGQSFTGQIAYLVPVDASPIFFSAFGVYIII